MVSNLLITDFNLKITSNKLLLRVTCWQQWKHITFYHRLQQKTQLTLQTVNYLLTLCTLYVILFFFLVVLTNNKCYNGWSHLGCLTGCSEIMNHSLNYGHKWEKMEHAQDIADVLLENLCSPSMNPDMQNTLVKSCLHMWGNKLKPLWQKICDLWTCRETDNGDLYNGDTICVCVGIDYCYINTLNTCHSLNYLTTITVTVSYLELKGSPRLTISHKNWHVIHSSQYSAILSLTRQGSV